MEQLSDLNPAYNVRNDVIMELNRIKTTYTSTFDRYKLAFQCVDWSSQAKLVCNFCRVTKQ